MKGKLTSYQFNSFERVALQGLTLIKNETTQKQMDAPMNDTRVIEKYYEVKPRFDFEQPIAIQLFMVMRSRGLHRRASKIITGKAFQYQYGKAKPETAKGQSIFTFLNVRCR